MKQLLQRPLSALPSPSEAVRHFAPSWFTIVMGTGIVASLIAQFPYDAPARNDVGWAFWFLSITQFLAFLAMLAARFAFFPSDALTLFDQPTQAMFLGAIPPSLSGIINGLLLFLAPRWNRSHVVTAAVVLWWANTGLALLCTILLPFYMFVRRQPQFKLERMTAVYLMPLIPSVVAAGSGGTVAHATSLSAADNIIHMSYILWGVSVPLCFMVMTVYLRRLMVHKLPPEERIVSSFLPVGPCGMAALALMTLGSAVVRQYPPPASDEVAAALSSGAGNPAQAVAMLPQVYTASAASVLLTVGNIGGLILWGAGIWWLLIAIVSVARTARYMHFSIGLPMRGGGLHFGSRTCMAGWWAFVFPLGVFTSAANTLWKQLPGMRALRPVSAVLTCCCILLWGVCSLLTLAKGYSGSLFYTPCLRRLPGAKVETPARSQSSGSIASEQWLEEGQQERRQAGQEGAGVARGRPQGGGALELELQPYGEP